MPLCVSGKFGIEVRLMVNALISGVSVPWETGVNPKIKPLGRWSVP
jgi:hypothetical protein